MSLVVRGWTALLPTTRPRPALSASADIHFPRRRPLPSFTWPLGVGSLWLGRPDSWLARMYVRVCACVYVSLLLSLSLSSVYVFLSRVCVLMCASLYVCSSELKQGCRIVASTGWSGRPQTQISIATCGQTDIIRGFTAPLPDGSIISVFQRSQVA